MTLGSAATTTVNSNLFVYDNTIVTAYLTPMATNNLIYLTATQNSEAFGNTFSVTPGSETSLPVNISFPDSDLGTIAWYDNKFSNGTVIPGPAGTVNHALSTVSTPVN